MKFIKNLKNNLFTINNEKMTQLSICLILIFDILLIGMVNDAVESQNKDNLQAYKVYPYACVNLYNKDLNLNYYSSTYTNKKQSKKCQNILGYYSGLKAEFKKNNKNQKITEQSAVYAKFIEYRDSTKDEFTKEMNSYKYKSKTDLYLSKLIFLLPLIGLFGFIYYKNKKSLLNNAKYSSVALVITTHILVILSIPIVFGFLDIVYDLIPKTLLHNFVTLLESLKLIFLFFYGYIIVSAIFIFWLISYIQKRHKNNYNNYSYIAKNIKKSQCFKCKNTVNYSSDKHCSVCNEELLVKCDNCSNLRIKNLPFCRHCGNK